MSIDDSFKQIKDWFALNFHQQPSLADFSAAACLWGPGAYQMRINLPGDTNDIERRSIRETMCEPGRCDFTEYQLRAAAGVEMWEKIVVKEPGVSYYAWRNSSTGEVFL